MRALEWMPSVKKCLLLYARGKVAVCSGCGPEPFNAGSSGIGTLMMKRVTTRGMSWWANAWDVNGVHFLLPVHINYKHRVPDWMPLRLHLALEWLMLFYPDAFIRVKPLRFLYHLIHGLICAYTLGEIRGFSRGSW
jgi:hypothetical protein